MNLFLRDGLRYVGMAGAILVFLPLLALENTYYQGLLMDGLVFALFAVALNVAFGHTDQLFLFVGGLAGVGAYVTALVADWLAVSAWATLPLAALSCGLIAAVVSWIAAKRKFTIVTISILTLTLQFAAMEVFVGATDVTRGSTGFQYEYFSLDAVASATGVPTDVVVYYILLGCLLLVLYTYFVLVNSKTGLAFKVIREDEVAAESTGIDVVRNKVIAGFVAGLIIGVTGTFYARSASYITPQLFSFLTVDTIVLVVLIVGGLRTLFGPLVGAAVVIAIEQVLASAPHWRTAIFGALLILLFLKFRNGIVVYLGERTGADWIADPTSERG